MAGYAADKGSQYTQDDGRIWTKVGSGMTDWVPPATYVYPVNGDVVAIAPGVPVAQIGGATKRANASSLSLSSVLGVVFLGAAITLPLAVVVSGGCTLTTAVWDAVTGQVGGLTPGAIYYAGLVAGTLSTSPPVAMGQSVVVVGRAITSTTLLVAVQPPIFL